MDIPNPSLIAHVEYYGDTSVGEPYFISRKITFEGCGICELESQYGREFDWRKDLRQQLLEVAILLYGEDAVSGIRFDDECENCGKVDCDGFCMDEEE